MYTLFWAFVVFQNINLRINNYINDFFGDSQ